MHEMKNDCNKGDTLNTCRHAEHRILPPRRLILPPLVLARVRVIVSLL